jgi:hypothetical protein
MDKPNPATSLAQLAEPAARKRIPMSVPTRRLEVPEIEGWHLHWFLESRVPRALQAGYVFVDFDEVPVNQRGIANDSTVSGNIDLGSRVRQIGGLGEDGRPEHLVLMKLKEEWWQEDRAAIDEKNARMMSSIFRDEQILGAERDDLEDQGTRYIDKSRTKALFSRPARKQ